MRTENDRPIGILSISPRHVDRLVIIVVVAINKTRGTLAARHHLIFDILLIRKKRSKEQQS
jgi:hypothetical protein